MTSKRDIYVPASIPSYVYVRSQGSTQCVDCQELTGGVAHILTNGQIACLECHVEAATYTWTLGWIARPAPTTPSDPIVYWPVNDPDIRCLDCHQTPIGHYAAVPIAGGVVVVLCIPCAQKASR